MRPVVWSYPIRLDLLWDGDVETVKPVVYCFEPGIVLPDREFDYIVEAGFRCDLTSNPQALASLAADKIRSAAGSLFHDHWCRVAVPQLGWSRSLGDDLAALIWAQHGHGSAVTPGQVARMHDAIRLYTALRKLVT